VILYFNLHFQKEKVKELFENEKISELLYEKIIKLGNFFEGLILPKENVKKLIQKANDYNQVLNLLPFLGKDVIQFLETINGDEEREKIRELYEKEKIKIEKENEQNKDKKSKKSILLIDIEKYTQPKKEDDIVRLTGLMTDLIDYQNENGLFFTKFSNSIFEKYIELSKGISYDNIGLIKSIIEYYKNIDSSFKFKGNINEIILENGINMAIKGLLKNLDLLEFIKTAEYFHDKKYDNKRSIEIMNGIDISKLEKNFFKTWKRINFYSVFKNNFNDFLIKISLLIKEMKDFGLLFSFYNFYQDNEYKYEYILYMQKRYLEIFNTYFDEKCPNFNDDTAKLIYWSDKKDVNLKKFLKENIQNLLNVEKVSEIYLKVIEEYQDLSKDIKEIIIEFITKNIDAELSNLLYFVKNCQKLRGELFSNINKLIIKEQDFFRPEENDRFKFFKGLVKEKLLEKVYKYKGAIYISKALMTISSLETKIQNYDISFTTLSTYFPDEPNSKLEELLKERFNYIYLLEKDKTEKNFQRLKDKMYEIKDKIKNLELIYKDFSYFFYISKKEDMKKLAEIIVHLKMDSLNYLDKNCKNDYSNYKKYLKDAQIRNKKKKSKFFNEIFDIEEKLTNENNDIARLNETEKKFNEFKILFEKDGIKKIDPIFVENYLRPFRNDEQNLESEIESEIKTLIDIFEIKDNINLKEILEGIILIYKKKYFFDIAIAVNIYIENLKVPKTNFSEDIKDIIQKLQEKKDIDTIRNSKNKLIEFKILDEKEKDNKLIQSLFKLREQPDSILFLFEIPIQEWSNWHEVSTQSDINYVTVNDLLDIEKCIEFYLNIGKKKDLIKINDDEIINKLKENISKNEQILVCIQSYMNNFGQIKLFQISVDKSVALKYIILGLFNRLTYVLSNEERDKFKSIYNDIKENNFIEDIVELIFLSDQKKENLKLFYQK